MNYVSAEQDNLDMLLTQMGAKVKSIHGLLCYVRFYLDDTELFYVYNLNSKNQFYLQRVKPYPVGAGVFSNSREVVNFIKNDIKRFKNAYNSKTFEKFIGINSQLHKTIHNIEDTFMEYNVPIEKMLEIERNLEQIDILVNEIKSTSPKIITK